MPVTPMMQQYLDVKQRHPDCIVFFRLGDFYEMFFDDAKLASKELELTLTGKDCGLSERAPMCGVPYHAAATYVSRLIERGHKVAICEQLTDPALSKGLVERDVIRIITPGTVVDPAMLDEKSNSYILCVVFHGKEAALAYTDVSTGEFMVQSLSGAAAVLRDELIRIRPNEIVTNDEPQLSGYLETTVAVAQLPESVFTRKNASAQLLEHFKVSSVSALGLEPGDRRLVAAGALLWYLSDTQKNALEHITRITPYQTGETMYLDRMTRRNLELTQSMHSGERRGSLLWLLDQTNTAMGARLLKTWVEEPLIDLSRIQARLNAVEALKDDYMAADELSEKLSGIADLERLLGKISYGSLNARDCLALGRSLSLIPDIKGVLAHFTAPAVAALGHTLSPLTVLCDLLAKSIHPEAPPTLSDGNIIADGYNAELDGYRDAATNGKQWVLDLETAERQETGIKNLRIQYNKVFGYFIEVTKSNLGSVPLRYTRKQTLTNCERFVTPELHEIERKITGAQQASLALEMQLFAEIRQAIAAEIPAIQQNAQAIKTLDALLSLAKVARDYDYRKPDMTEDGIIDIKGGRHPLVERMQSDTPFVPNDVLLDENQNRMLIITGPNMAGKSTYMRQVAQIVVMAHIGSFVPAQEAHIGLCDRVFTRIGASDDLAGGQSTFMVEMSETANIL
ncbi:MAG: DNA mismatch repair protein MutS, partial [Eubacteriales bacterium]|nr:DNA mismatch repair protein MutS [Eubacteriales bacterium]